MVVPGQQLDDALTQLVPAELIFRRGTPPDAEYTFKHALVQDAAYSTLLRGQRQQLHAVSPRRLKINSQRLWQPNQRWSPWHSTRKPGWWRRRSSIGSRPVSRRGRARR